MTALPDSKKLTPVAQLKVFIDRLDAKNQKLCRSVRTALRKRFPTANELVYDYASFVVIGYSPTENGIESVVSFAARATGVSLYFNNGPRLPDPKKLLQGSGKQTRFIPIESAERLAHPDVKALIAATINMSTIPLPTTGKGQLIIKTIAAERRPRAKPKK
ncbi:MAG: hypothetical protein ABI411_21220 [Tahibacter sp.]